MFDPTSIDLGQVSRVARDGSPLLLQAIGRLYGVGPAERHALGADGSGVPSWTWAALAFAAGTLVGIRLYRAYPKQIPRMISGA